MRTIFILFILINTSAFSQVSGIIGGSISYSSPKFGYGRAGTPFGISLRQNLNDNIFLTESAIYRFDGYYFKSDVKDLGYKSICHQINFLELPFMVNFITKSGKVKPYLGLGFSPKVAIWTAERIAVQYRNFEFRDLPLSHSVDLNLLGSLGAEIKILNHPIRFEARYNHGLATIVDNRKISSFSFLCFIR